MGAADAQGGAGRKGGAQHDTELSSCYGDSDMLLMHPEDWGRSSLQVGRRTELFFSYVIVVHNEDEKVSVGMSAWQWVCESETWQSSQGGGHNFGEPSTERCSLIEITKLVWVSEGLLVLLPVCSQFPNSQCPPNTLLSSAQLWLLPLEGD